MNGNIHIVKGKHLKGNVNTDFNGVVGQKSVTNKLSFFMETHSKSTPVPTMIFTGSHGLGKTYIASKMAKGMGRKYVEVNCGSIKTEKDFLYNILINRVVGDEPVTILMDESHELSQDITTLLLTLLNPNKSMENSIYIDGWNFIYNMSNINIIFATTDAHKMFKPLLNRCERIYFESYNENDLLQMVYMYSPSVTFKCDKKELALACRGRGRDAFNLSQKINRYVMSKNNGDGGFLEEDWSYLKDVFEIFPMGLNKQEVQLLDIINKHEPISCNNIALSMMINSENVESEIEIRPRELGLIASTTRGRVLTGKGKKYMEGIE